jgi:hypothetical protein
MMIAVHTVLSLALLWSGYCRAIRMNHTTRRDIRLAFWALSVAAAAVASAPLRGWMPDWPTEALLLAVVAVQYTTALHWRAGVPDSFVAPEHRPPAPPFGE